MALPSMPRLGPLELKVMEHLWKAGECDVGEAHRVVDLRRHISANTVGSALERLHRKGLVRRWKVSHAYRYAGAMDRETFYAQRMLEAAGSARALAKGGLLAAFVDLLAENDTATLDRLDALIQRKRRETSP